MLCLPVQVRVCFPVFQIIIDGMLPVLHAAGERLGAELSQLDQAVRAGGDQRIVDLGLRAGGSIRLALDGDPAEVNRG